MSVQATTATLTPMISLFLSNADIYSCLEPVGEREFMIVPDEISQILDNEQVDYVRHHDDVCDRWLIICAHVTLSVELLASGEHLRVRTGPVADASVLCKESKYELFHRAMDANGQQMIGRFGGVEHIDYEIGMAFPGRAVLFAEQLIQALRTAAAVAYDPCLTIAP